MLYQIRQIFLRKWFEVNCNNILKIRPVISNPNDNLAIVTMVSHLDVLMYIIAIKSFFKQVNHGKVIILNDGSLTNSDKAKLNKHIKLLQIININDLKTSEVPKRNCWERLWIISDIVRDHYVIQLDADTVTLNEIPEVIKNINTNCSFAIGTERNQNILPIKIACEKAKLWKNNFIQVVAEASFDKLKNHEDFKYTRCSASFTGFAKGSFSTKDIIKFSKQMEEALALRWSEWGSEQVTSNFIICNSSSANILPYPKYASYHANPKIDYRDCSFLHFIGTSRFKKGLYIERARSAINNLNRNPILLQGTKIQNINYFPVGDLSVESGRGPGQQGWYKFASNFCEGHSVLDIGCGMGKGLEILSTKAKSVVGIDKDERLKKSNILIKDISEFTSKSIDTITAIDVIEHVKDDLNFIEQLARVAKHQIIISTPNWTAGRCKWPYHIREYMPHQLVNIFKQYGKISLFKGSPEGNRVYKVKYLNIYFIFNKWRVLPVFGLLAKCLNNLIPKNSRINSHSCIIINLK